MRNGNTASAAIPLGLLVQAGPYAHPVRRNIASAAIQLGFPSQWPAASAGLGKIALLALCLWGLPGCTHAQPASTGADQPSLQLPDPSVALCLKRGHELAPMRKAGIVQSHLCINPKTSLKCDSWAYYRGECSLERQQPPQKPPAPKHRPTAPLDASGEGAQSRRISRDAAVRRP